MPSIATYWRRKAAGLCPGCGQPRDRADQVLCRPCADAHNAYKLQWTRDHAARLQQARDDAREARWAAQGANLVGCCGQLHPVTTLPHRFVCCGKVLGLIEENTHASD
jgi:hypothetical protein